MKNNIVMRRREERISSLINRNWKSLSSDERAALVLTYEKDILKTMQLAEFLSKSRQYARKILKSLEDKGLIRLVATSISDPNQHYVLNSNKVDLKE